MGRRDAVAGGDQAYLRDVQYRDSSRLAARASLHVKYGTAPVAWFPWVATQVSWSARARVLDVGCGAGWLWAEASAHVPSGLDLTLTDLSQGMVAEALERVGGLGRHRNVVGRVSDAQALPFPAGTFDVAIANHMLYHVPEPARAVAELARVMTPGGLLVVATVGADHLRELDEIRSEVFGRPRVAATVAAFGVDVGGSILRSWFGAVEWRRYDDWLDCSDPDDVVAFLASTPPVEDATGEQRSQVAAAVGRRFADGGGRMRVSKETGLFLCRLPRLAT
ncbi:MAG: class I SAM-dependent methyltransferase [Acidimicrobiales bacterium]